MKEKCSKKKLQKVYSDFLENQQYFKVNTINSKRWLFSKLIKYLDDNGIMYYTQDVGNSFLEWICDTKSTSMYNMYRSHIYEIERILNWRNKRPNCFYDGIHPFEGELGLLAKKHLQRRSEEKRWSNKTKWLYSLSLSRFTSAMHVKEISLENLNEDIILSFFSSKKNLYKTVYAPVRTFLKDLYEQGKTNTDFSWVLNGMKDSNHIKLPSYYTAEEIKLVEDTIDRTSPIGKRNYCMILLASRLGIRCSDIVSLQFENIDWNHNIIKFHQFKTGNSVTLPLLNEIGEALIDYLQNGRRKTDSKYIFIAGTGLDSPIQPARLSAIVRSTFSKAGIDTDSKRHSAHALRHSYATALMNSNAPLTIVSSALGHQSVQSTMMYLGIDIKQLLECSLSVSFISDDFYKQEGGFFYE